jgi:flagellar hook-associated protein 2
MKSSDSLGGKSLLVSYGDSNNPAKTDTIAIPATATTLQQAVDYINDSANKFGVTANLISDTSGVRLVLKSKTDGAAGNLTVDGDINFKQGSPGVNAQLTVDGVPIESASNTVTGAIPGITLNLTSADSATPVQLTVSPDSNEAANAIGNFVNAYNAVIKDINGQYTVNSSTGNEGPLASDSALRVVQSQLLSSVSFSSNGIGSFPNLQSLGVEMQNDGTLQLNSSVMSNTLTSHYSDFQNFFQSAAPQGFGQSVGNLLMQLTDITEGPVQVDINGLDTTNRDLSTQINNFEDRMTTVQQQLTQQYSLINTLLQQYPGQVQQITAELGSLPTATTK